MPVKRLCDGRDRAIFFGALFEETSWECWDATTAPLALLLMMVVRMLPPMR